MNPLRERIRSVVRRFKRRDVSARFDTSDVIQEVQLQVWQRAQKLPGETGEVAPALLSTITKRHVSKFHRRHHAVKRSVQKEVPQDQSPVSNELSPHERVAFKELRNQLLTAIDGLPAESRQILVARIFHKKTLADVSGETGLSIDQVQRRYHSAIQQIKQSVKVNE